MRVLVYGAGAIGSYLGGSLALAGEEVSFIARPAQAEVLNSNGLTLQAPDGQTQAAKNVRAYTTPREAMSGDAPVTRLYDCIILALKSFDTETAIADLRATGQPIPPIVCVQNGVDNEPKLREAFGAEKVIAGTVLTSTSIPEPGRVVIEKSRGVGLGAGHPLSERLAEALRQGGVKVTLYQSSESMKWSKLVTNLMANATAAICDLSTADVYAHPGLFEIEVRQMKEALRVMEAKGLMMVALPKSPSRELGFALRWLPAWLYQPVIQRAVGGARGGKQPSLHQDLSGGKRRSEIGYLNGAVARHAETLGISAPVNRALTEILEGIIAGQIAWEEYRGKPEKLVSRIFPKRGR